MPAEPRVPEEGVLPCGRAHGGSASCPPGSARAKPNSLWESRRGCPEPLHSFVALATASSFLSSFSATGTVAYPRAAATSCYDLLSPFPVMQNRSRVGVTLLVKRSVSSCTFSLPTNFGEKAHPEKNCHYLRVGFDDLKRSFPMEMIL